MVRGYTIYRVKAEELKPSELTQVFGQLPQIKHIRGVLKLKQLFSKYIEENHITTVKELALIKAYQAYNANEERFRLELIADRANLLEELEKELLLYRGYSLMTREELYNTISYVLDGLIEEYSKSILDNLNNL